MSWGLPGVLQEQGSAEHQLRCRCVQGAWQPGDNLQEGLGGGREASSRSGDSLEKQHCGVPGDGQEWEGPLLSSDTPVNCPDAEDHPLASGLPARTPTARRQSLQS